MAAKTSPNFAGLTVIDDWSSFGQRTTLSGTVTLENVKVPKTHLVPGYKGYEVASADGIALIAENVRWRDAEKLADMGVHFAMSPKADG